MVAVVEVMGQRCLIPKDAGERLGLSAYVVRNMVRRGDLPGVRVAGKFYALEAGVERERQRIERDMAAALATLEETTHGS